MSAEMKEVEEFVRQYFIDDERASINDCVRDGLDLRIPVNPGLVSNIRRRMRQESFGKPKLVVVPPPPPTKAQAKSWVNKWPADKPPPVVDIPEPVEPKEEKKQFATVAERRKYYDDILLEDPTQTVVAAMKKVKVKFGRSVDPGYAVASLRAVRELIAGASMPETTAPPPSPPTTPAPKESPVSKEEHDEYAIIFFPSTNPRTTETVLTNKSGVQQKLMELSAKGIDSQNIRVFKQVKVKLKVTVDFGD